MFINCPFCRALVPTDPATDLPPERCPRCAMKLREQVHPPAAVDGARSGVASAIAEVHDGEAAAEEDPMARPAVSIATLLHLPPEPAPDVPADEPESAVAPELEPTPGPPGEPGAGPAPGPEPASTPGPAPGPAPASEDAPAAASGAAIPAPEPSSRPVRPGGRAAPSFARRRLAAADGRGAGRRWPLPAVVVALSMLLVLQWLLADRARLAADPAWRPVVAGACAVLRCSLPPWREPSAFVLLERDVRPHPDAANALRITASFRNDADWAQAWPEVVLTLNDIDGRPLGQRAFTAAEYLDGAPPSTLVESGQGAVIRMDVLEPGPGAVGFSFDFH